MSSSKLRTFEVQVKMEFKSYTYVGEVLIIFYYSSYTSRERNTLCINM
jgi:hypothetical protein